MPKLMGLPFSVLLLTLLVTSGCVGGMSNSRLLQSMAVTPATAVAPNPGGQVQFSASGQYSAPPSPSPVMNATWCVSDSNGCTITSNVTVDASGMTQCDSSFSGVVTVRGMAPNGAGSPVMMSGGTGVLVSATAQLTCP